MKLRDLVLVVYHYTVNLIFTRFPSFLMIIIKRKILSSFFRLLCKPLDCRALHQTHTMTVGFIEWLLYLIFPTRLLDRIKSWILIKSFKTHLYSCTVTFWICPFENNFLVLDCLFNLNERTLESRENPISLLCPHQVDRSRHLLWNIQSFLGL